MRAAIRRVLLLCGIGLLAVTLMVPGGFTAGSDAWAWEVPMGEFVTFLRTGDSPADLFFWLIGPFDFVFLDLGN